MMRRFLLPLLLLVLGLGGGLGAGWWLRPPVPVDSAAVAEGAGLASYEVNRALGAPLGEVQRLPSQFVIPVLADGRVRALVALSLAVSIAPGQTLDLVREEARLRAVLLQTLFDHANFGGFDGDFTNGEQLLRLRRNLTDTARAEFGPMIQTVVIVDLVRQEQP